MLICSVFLHLISDMFNTVGNIFGFIDTFIYYILEFFLCHVRQLSNVIVNTFEFTVIFHLRST